MNYAPASASDAICAIAFYPGSLFDYCHASLQLCPEIAAPHDAVISAHNGPMETPHERPMENIEKKRQKFPRAQ
jgi:hypothetical protein